MFLFYLVIGAPQMFFDDDDDDDDSLGSERRMLRICRRTPKHEQTSCVKYDFIDSLRQVAIQVDT